MGIIVREEIRDRIGRMVIGDGGWIGSGLDDTIADFKI